MRKQFRFPFFVAPHAMKRFRERVADLSDDDIIFVIQAILQDPGAPVQMEYGDSQLTPIFAAKWKGKYFYFPVIKGKEDWPMVPTVYGEETELHKRYISGGLKSIYKQEAQNGK